MPALFPAVNGIPNGLFQPLGQFLIAALKWVHGLPLRPRDGATAVPERRDQRRQA
jgi:hypothetical protein